MVFSADDEISRPSARLLSLAQVLIEQSQKVDLSDISYRMTSRPFFPDIWPGEHYKLLAAIVQVLQPKIIIEIGTAEGLSALALKKFLPPAGVIHTFDIRPWNSVHGAVLIQNDFADNRLVQHTDNLGELAAIKSHQTTLEAADLIFVDASKDGRFEAQLLENLETLNLGSNPLVIFDDIKLWNMLPIWREVKRPKLDFTSFGHWSGTGLIDWVA